MQISHLTLSFQGKDAHLEEGFLKNYLEISIQVFRIAVVLAFVIYAEF